MTAFFGVTIDVEDERVGFYPSANTLENLEKRLAESKDLEEITKIKDEIASIKQNQKSFKNKFNDIQEEVTIDLFNSLGNNIGNLLLPELIKGFAEYARTGTLGDKRSTKYKEEEGAKSVLRSKESLIEEIASDLDSMLRNIFIEYIYAHSVSQQVFYSSEKDANDYVTKTIRDYYQARISEGDDEYKFIKHWMSVFEIGNSVIVHSYEGAAYRVIVFRDEEKGGCGF